MISSCQECSPDPQIYPLASYEEFKQSVEWQALKELYKVDLESFVTFDGENINLGASGVSADYGMAPGEEGTSEGEEGNPEEPEAGPEKK